MLTQPLLRFLLADEPGTGKTIMSGLWLGEAQRGWRGIAKPQVSGLTSHKPETRLDGSRNALLMAGGDA